MLKVLNKEIHLSKGDDASIEISLTRENQPYILENGDKVVFSVGETELRKELTNEGGSTVNLVLSPADTKNLNTGFYYYDLKMLYGNGTTNALIPPTIFEVMDVVE